LPRGREGPDECVDAEEDTEGAENEGGGRGPGGRYISFSSKRGV